MRSRRKAASLDALNFLLADVRGALGPYLNVFLVTQQRWSLGEVGVVTMVGGLLGLAVQTPVGGLIDATRRKRGLIVAALAAMSAATSMRWAVLAARAWRVARFREARVAPRASAEAFRAP